MATISQRISLEGSEDILKQLAELGKTGEQAFKQIQDAAKKPITDPAQIDRTKQAINELAAAGARLGPQFQQLADSTKQFGTQGEQAAKQVTAGLNQTGAAAQQAGTNIQQASQQASSAGAGIGATLAKAAVVFGIAATGIAAAISAVTSALTSGAAETSTSIADQAEKLKVTVAQWLELRKAIAGNKLTNEDLQKSISGLTENFAKAGGGIQRLGKGVTEQTVKLGDSLVTIRRYGRSLDKDVQSEADKAATAVGKLGIRTKDIAGGDVIAALRKMADGIAAIPDETKRAEAGTAAFGEKWKELVQSFRTRDRVVDDSTKSIAELGRANRDLSAADVLKGADLTKKWEDLQKAIRATKDLIGSLFFDPALARADWLTQIVDGSRELLRTWLGLDKIKGQGFLAGLGDSPAETTFKLLVALGQQLAGIWRDILVPAGEALIDIVGEIAGGFENVTGTQVAAFFIVAAIAVTGLLIALKGIALVLSPIGALISTVFSPLGLVLLAAAAAAALFWNELKEGARTALALIPQEIAQVKEAFALLFKGDFAGFWEKFSKAAVSAFGKLKEAVLQASGVIPDLLRAITGREVRIPWVKQLTDGFKQIGRELPGTIETISNLLAGLGRIATGVANTINNLFGTKLTGTDIGVILILAQMTGALQALASIAVIAGIAFGGFIRAVGLLALAIGGLPAAILLVGLALAGLFFYLNPQAWENFKNGALAALREITPEADKVWQSIKRIADLLTGEGSSAWESFKNAAVATIKTTLKELNAILSVIEFILSAFNRFLGLTAPGAPLPAPGGVPMIDRAPIPPEKKIEVPIEITPKPPIPAPIEIIPKPPIPAPIEIIPKPPIPAPIEIIPKPPIPAPIEIIPKPPIRVPIEPVLPPTPDRRIPIPPAPGLPPDREELPIRPQVPRPALDPRKELIIPDWIGPTKEALNSLGASITTVAANFETMGTTGVDETGRIVDAFEKSQQELEAIFDTLDQNLQEQLKSYQQLFQDREKRLRPPRTLPEEPEAALPQAKAALAQLDTGIATVLAKLESGIELLQRGLWGTPPMAGGVPGAPNPIIPEVEIPVEVTPKPPIQIPTEVTPEPPIQIPIDIDPEATVARLERELQNLNVPSGPVLVAARGGLLGGRGTGTSDSNLAWLSRGEHIMPARAVRQPGVLAFLEALRRSGGNLQRALDGVGRFALGGLVPRHMTIPAFADGGLNGGNNVTIQFPGLPPISGLRASSDVVDQLHRAAALAQVRSGGRKPRPVFLMPAYTLLSIDGVDFSQYAVRGITMTLAPIDQAANVARDCRGALADISVAQFRQYKISVTCTDHEAPELTDVWPGQDVTITCIPGLGVANTTGDVLTILAKVTTWNSSRDEWAGEIAWTLEAEQRVP